MFLFYVIAPLVPLDGRCNHPDICADPNAVCESGLCICEKAYRAQNATCGKILMLYVK